MGEASGHEKILQRMDESKVTKVHWKVMFTSGMGFCTMPGRALTRSLAPPECSDAGSAL
jgi:hypothetical protein